MRKYLVPKEDGTGWKLIVSGKGVPSHAVCEAPENWTREMEPYIDIKTITSGGEKKCIPSLTKGYFDKINGQASEKFQVDLKRMEKIRQSLDRAEKNKKFNELNVPQRFVKSILGEFTDAAKPVIVRYVLKQIFGDKIP